MAASGVAINRQVITKKSEQEVASYLMQSFNTGGGYFDQTTVTPMGTSGISIQRKYLPTAMIVIAIIGALCALLGLIALAFRKTENCNITIQKNDSGTTTVSVNGTISPNMQSVAQSMLSQLESA
jgi:hypothetical protein